MSYSDHLLQHQDITGVPNYSTRNFISRLVDVPSMYDVVHTVDIAIERAEPESDFLIVFVTERAAGKVIFQQTYRNMTVAQARAHVPGPDTYGHAVPVYPGGGNPIPQHSFGGQEAITRLIRLQYGDYGESHIAAWQSHVKDGEGHIVNTDIQLHYVRRGYDGLTNTSTWLAQPKLIG